MITIELFLTLYVITIPIYDQYWRGVNLDQEDRDYLWVTSCEKASIYARPTSWMFITNRKVKVLHLTSESWSRLLELFLESFQETNQQDFSKACSVDERDILKRDSKECPEETAYIQFLLFCMKKLRVDAISYEPSEKNEGHHYEVLFLDKTCLTKTSKSEKNGRCKNVPSKKQKKRKSYGFTKTSPGKRHKSPTHSGQRLSSPTHSGERLWGPTHSGERLWGPTHSGERLDFDQIGEKEEDC